MKIIMLQNQNIHLININIIVETSSSTYKKDLLCFLINVKWIRRLDRIFSCPKTSHVLLAIQLLNI